jgi:hypothetical protein
MLFFCGGLDILTGSVSIDTEYFAVERKGQEMPVSVELKTLQHAVDALRTALASLQGKYGEVPTVKRLRNDLDRLILDVADVHLLPPTHPSSAVPAQIQLTDEPYDPSMWSDDADDEGVGGYHGASR